MNVANEIQAGAPRGWSALAGVDHRAASIYEDEGPLRSFRPVHFGMAPIDYGPILLFMPSDSVLRRARPPQ